MNCADTSTLKPAVGTVGVEVRERVCRVANVIKSLANLFLPVHLTVAMELYWALYWDLRTGGLGFRI